MAWTITPFLSSSPSFAHMDSWQAFYETEAERTHAPSRTYDEHEKMQTGGFHLYVSSLHHRLRHALLHAMSAALPDRWTDRAYGTHRCSRTNRSHGCGRAYWINRPHGRGRASRLHGPRGTHRPDRSCRGRWSDGSNRSDRSNRPYRGHRRRRPHRANGSDRKPCLKPL